jgi:diaminopimelate decarboxylase
MTIIKEKSKQRSLEEILGNSTSPFFLYDLNALKEHLQSLKLSYQAGPFKFYYALKANPLSAIIDVVAEEGFGFDCASLGELKHVLSRGVNPKEILLTGPAKSSHFLDYAIDKGISLFVLESIEQLRLLEGLCLLKGKKVEAMLRFQLDWSAVSHEKSCLGGVETTVFGLPVKEWRKFPFESLKGVKIIGGHVFQWGNILNLSFLKEIWQKTLDQILLFEKELSLSFTYLDLGGGVGLNYQTVGGQIKPSAIQDLLTSLEGTGKFNKVLFELGRYLVGPFGKYYTRVIDKKKLKEKSFLILQGGINHLLRPFITGQAFPVRKIGKSSGSLKKYFLHGPLCTAADHLSSASLCEETKIGDYLEFSLCGAYGFTESMPFFLCHELPAEYVIKNKEIMEVREVQDASIWLK